MHISDALLTQVRSAPVDRVVRALEALKNGDMSITLKQTSPDFISAEVESYTILGKRNPVEKISTYEVFLSPTYVGCSCEDWHYRQATAPGFVCKHLLATIFTAQESQEQKQAA